MSARRRKVYKWGQPRDDVKEYYHPRKIQGSYKVGMLQKCKQIRDGEHGWSFNVGEELGSLEKRVGITVNVAYISKEKKSWISIKR